MLIKYTLWQHAAKPYAHDDKLFLQVFHHNTVKHWFQSILLILIVQLLNRSNDYNRDHHHNHHGANQLYTTPSSVSTEHVINPAVTGAHT